jgi:hypothetical protein
VKVEVVKPRSRFDRQLAIIALQRLFDGLPGSITRCYQLQADARRINSLVEKGALPVSKARALLAGIDTQFRILKETVLDRTVPVLARVDVQALMALLPRPESDDAVVEQVSDEQRAKQESVALLHAAIARLSAAGSERPGLVLIRRDDAARAS